MQNEPACQVQTENSPEQIRDEDYDVFCSYLESTCGITLGNNKRYLVNSRLRPMMEEHGYDSLKLLVKAAQSESSNRLKVQVINAMTTNETSWFRDIYPYDYLKDVILPDFSRSANGIPKIWSAACSYGHEPYSISIAVQEYLDKNPGLLSKGVEITGTDISTRALEQARQAEYDDLNLSRGLSDERMKKYFIRHDKKIRVSDKVKSRVRFFELNLLNSFTLLGKFDLVFCRNVLIYFSNENKSEILARIGSVMKPNAWLFLGASESIANYSDAFDMINCPRGVVYQKKS